MLGSQLAARRMALGLSLREVAKRAGLSHTHIRDMELGTRLPSLDTLQRLSTALACSFVISAGATQIEKEEPDEQQRPVPARVARHDR